MKHSHFLDQQHISETNENGTWNMGMVGIRSFLFGESPGWSVANYRYAGKGHGIYGHLPGVRANLQGDWTDELVFYVKW